MVSYSGVSPRANASRSWYCRSCTVLPRTSVMLVLAIPAPVFGFRNPLPLGADSHIAAVALFGNGTRKVLGPLSGILPRYGDKTIDLCNAEDPVCSANIDPNTWADDWPDHLARAYIDSGLINQAAAFVSARL